MYQTKQREGKFKIKNTSKNAICNKTKQNQKKKSYKLKIEKKPPINNNTVLIKVEKIL
jgi:hypothetical protein